MEKMRYFEVEMKLAKVNQILIEMFKNAYLKRKNVAWEDSAKFGAKLINGIGYSLYDKSKKIQQQFLEDGNSQKWDITLIVDVLRETAQN